MGYSHPEGVRDGAQKDHIFHDVIELCSRRYSFQSLSDKGQTPAGQAQRSVAADLKFDTVLQAEQLPAW